MDGLHFIYFSDPMCSWCWGFSPVIEALRRRYADILPIRLVMGGLRPGTDQPMSEEAKQQMLGYWEQVAKVTGQGFCDGLLALPGFTYDTDPAARATVLARRTGADEALDYLARAQGAFYAEGRDVTDFEVLADIAGEMGFHRPSFRAALEEESLKLETTRVYAIAQRAGANGIPTLILGPKADGTYALVCRGYQDGAEVLGAIDRLLATAQPASE